MYPDTKICNTELVIHFICFMEQELKLNYFSVSISWFCVYCSIGWKCCQQHYMSVSCQTKFSADTTNRAVIGAEIKFTIAPLYFTRLPVSGLQSPYSNRKRNILTCVCYEHISIKVIRQLWLREILAMMFVKKYYIHQGALSMGNSNITMSTISSHSLSLSIVTSKKTCLSL